MGRRSTVTLKDIAAEAGVSVPAVSEALAPRSRRVFLSDETRQRIRWLARQRGYPLERLRPRALQMKRVSVLCPPGWDYEHAAVLMADLLNRQDCRVTLHACPCNREARQTAERDIYRKHADGAILIGSRSAMEEVPADDVPCVVIGEAPEGAGVWRVTSDNRAGGASVGEHLWALGHRQVAIIVYDGLSSAWRLAGLREVWQRQGRSIPDTHVLTVPPGGAAALTERLIPFLKTLAADGPAPTAVVCTEDWLALVALDALRRGGRRVPEDLSVTGYADSHFAAYAHPPLTTVDECYEQLARLAVGLLAERLGAPPGAPPRVVRVPGRLIVRDSTGPPGRWDR